MNIHRIEILLSRYFEGETSLAEEKELKDFFRRDDIPEKFLPLKNMFDFAEEENKQLLDDSFDNQVLKKINEKKSGINKAYRKIYLYIASGVAATVLMVIGLFNLVNPRIDQQDIDTAYEQTRDALIYVSSKLNQGMKPASKMGKFNEEMQNIEKISAYEKGMENLSKITKIYEKPKEILINNNN